MIDRDKVFNKVTAIVADMQEEVDEWKDYSDSELRGGLTCDCDWWYKTLQTLKDALALLKAKEPRVMTLEEVKQHNNQDGCVWFEQPTYNAVAAFVLKDDFMIQVISPYILGEPINHGYWTNGNYGKTWRCWTSRPTDEQREATLWN